jgi:hypothetical protein
MFLLAPEFWLLALMSQYLYILSHQPRRLMKINVGWIRDSIVSIATGYVLDGQGVRVQVLVGSRIFLFSTLSRPSLGPTQTPVKWVPGALSLGVKR